MSKFAIANAQPLPGLSQLISDQFPSTIPTKIQGATSPIENKTSLCASKINFINSGNVSGNPINTAYPSNDDATDSSITKIVTSSAAYHKKLIPVTSGMSKKKFNKLGACAIDPSITSIRADVVNVVKSKNRKLNSIGTTAVVFKNISMSKINFAGNCASKLSVPLGENAVIKMYCDAIQHTVNRKFICKTTISFLKTTSNALVNPLVNK